ncbi:MAG: hypothetical protein U0R50_00345 [Gaiellales bacterium]
MSEAVFLLLVLKIPVVYLCLVVWWAIRAEPQHPDPEVPVLVPDTPPSPLEPVPGLAPRAPRPSRREAPSRRASRRMPAAARTGGRR